MQARRIWLGLVGLLMGLTLVAGAQGQGLEATAATLKVDNDKKDCPDAGYRTIRAAIGDASPGDTIYVCAGTYAEGPGTPGSNALIIQKSLTLKGAGADIVTVEPKRVGANQIAGDVPNLRNGEGYIVAVIGQVNTPINVDISGITFDANGVYAIAGVVFSDAGGSLNRSRVTGLDIDESATGYTVPGGFRFNQFGIGVAQVTRATPTKAGTPKTYPVRTLTIDHTRIDQYNAIGVLVDGATGNYAPATLPTPASYVASGVVNKAILTSDQIVGRNSCQNYNDPTVPPEDPANPGHTIANPTVIDGDCQPSGSGATGIHPPLPLTTGPLFGQDGVRATAGAIVQISGSTVSSNLVHGTSSPIGSVFAPTPNNDPYALGNHAENNQNLRLGGGVRLLAAGASTITSSNITDNAFGVLNTKLDGSTANNTTPVVATNNWWGLRTGALTLPTNGPAVWTNVASPVPTVFNPPVPENPVNGSPVADANCPFSIPDSDAVTFCPYRSSAQSDSVGGEWPIPAAPIAQTDPPVCTPGNVQYDPNIPTYDAFFAGTLGNGITGDGLSGATPGAKKTTQLSAYMQALATAVNNNPGTTGQRVGLKLFQAGTSVLGVPFYVAVVGTADNIANLDAGRNDQAFWRGVIEGTTSQASALSQVGVRPGFGWITGTPHGNEPAGGEASTKELYELLARTDCANQQRLSALDVFIQPVTAPDDRDHNVRTLAWAFDPNRDRGTVVMPENQALLKYTAKYPGLFFIDAHQQTSGYFFPPNQDAALNEISHFALDTIQDLIGPSVQQSFNDQTGQYRNYNTYDLFVPEYGDTVPALIMGGAGMTYEKGTNESYGKQVYDHYLAMDATVNAIAAEKADLMKDWVAQWPEAISQGQSCTVQDNTTVSPPLINLFEIGQRVQDQNPNVNACGYFFLPDKHSGDVAATIKELQLVGVHAYQLTAPAVVPGIHRFGNFDIAAVQPASPALTETMTLPAGTLYIPLNQGNKHWIQGVLGENPYLPYHYFYDEVTWSYSLLRGFAGDGFLTQQLPAGTPMAEVIAPGATTAPPAGKPVYAFNTDSTSGLAMVNQLLGQGAAVSRGTVAFDSGGVHFVSGAALVDGTSIAAATLNADSNQWGTPVYGLDAYPVSHYTMKLPKIGVYTGGTTAPTNPAFHGSGDGQCTTASYCEVMFDLTQREGIPTSQIGQITSTDLAAGVLVSQGYTTFINPTSTIAAGAGATALQAFVNAGGTYIGALAGGTTSARNAGITLLNTSSVSGISTPGSTFDATWNTADPAAWGFDAGGWIYRESSNDPLYNPATLGTAVAVATYAPAGDCGGPAGFTNCYGYEVNANANLPGRPVVVDQPFGAGHAILLGFDAWYRAWTQQEERLVLNGVLYPSGSAIPAAPAAAQARMADAHEAAPNDPIPADELPAVADRPLDGTIEVLKPFREKSGDVR